MEYKFLPALMGRIRAGFTGSGSAVSHAISGSTAATSGPYGGAFTAFGGGWDVEQSVKEGLERVIWVYRCVDAIASNQAKLKFIVRDKDPETGQLVKDDDLNFTLNRRPNSYETAKQFRYRLSAQLLISKRGAFIEKQRANSGRYRLHLLPPQNVEPIPDPEKFVAGYRLMTANEGEVILKPEDVIWIRAKPHPIDPYLQLNPLTASSLAIETDFLARLFNRNFLLNDGRPGMLIGISGQVNTRDAQEMKDRFSGSPHTAGRTSVIEADGISVNDLGASPRDLQWLEAITGTKSDILLAFGTPESVLGNAAGRTYDNADAEAEVWWEETMVPHCDAISSGFDLLTGGMDDDKFLTYDYDAVDVLQRRKRARHDKAREEFMSGTRTLDELFEVTGREKWDVAGTRVLILPNGMIVGRNSNDTDAVAELPVVGVQQQADVAKEAQRGAELGAAKGQRNFSNIISARAMQLAKKSIESKAYIDAEELGVEVEEREHPYSALRLEAELGFGNFLEQWTNFQEETILGRLGHAKALKYTRHWVGDERGMPKREGKALNAGYVVDTSRWSQDLEADMQRMMARITREGLKSASEEMHASGITRAMFAMGAGNARGVTPLMKVFTDRAGVNQTVSGLLVPFQDIVQQAAQRQSDRVAQVIADMDQQGASMKDIKSRVSAMMSTRGSWRTGLATSLTTSLIEAARHEAFNRAGDIVTKFWNTVEDEHVRPTHEAVDGKEQPIDQPYRVGKYHMQYPGDPSGGVEERINCFPADSLVGAGAVTGAFRRWYSGIMVKVVIPSGEEVAGTPNHPVLTQRGWVPLGKLVKGDKVVRHHGDVKTTGRQDVNRMPATIGETFDALAMTRDVVRVPSLGVNFHGERPHGDIDVVATFGELRDNPDTPADKFVREFLLPAADVLPGLLANKSSGSHLRSSALGTPNSVVSSFGQRNTLRGSGSTHSGAHGVTTVSRFDTSTDQSLAERPPVDPDLISQSLLGLPGEVTLDEVVQVRYEQWSGHVYNLQTETGAYTINGIVVHNCRCYADYAISEEAEELYDVTAGNY